MRIVPTSLSYTIIYQIIQTKSHYHISEYTISYYLQIILSTDHTIYRSYYLQINTKSFLLYNSIDHTILLLLYKNKTINYAIVTNLRFYKTFFILPIDKVNHICYNEYNNKRKHTNYILRRYNIMTRYTDWKNEWFEMWLEDKNSILNCMYNNREADLNAGYSLYSKSIIDQNEMIDSYSKSIDEALENFKTMTEAEVDHWCYYDLKKRGAID